MKTKNVDRPSKVTLSDIATAAGVSVSAVSLAMRGKESIPVDTRQHILKVADSLGYIRKLNSPSERPQGRLHTLGLIAKSDVNIPLNANPFYSHIVAGIEETCRRKKINLLFATMPVDEHNLPTELPRLLTENSADGLLLVGAFVNETLAHILGERTLPVVLVDAYAGIGDYDSVVSDNLLSARQAVSYLIEHGHQHIGMLGNSLDAYPSVRERALGYDQAMREHDLTPYYINCSFDRLSAYQAVSAALAEYPVLTAIFGCNDDLTLGAMSAARDHGRRVPEDISFVGFDDVEWAAQANPPLTTMRVDKHGMGRLAVQLLNDRIEYPESTPVTVALHARLVERQSVARL